MNIEVRLWAKVNKTGTCWLWTAAKDKRGYGRFWDCELGKVRLAHRVSYELHYGVFLAKEVRLDHKCHVHECIRPDHLREVTQKQNLEHLKSAHVDSASGVRGVTWDKATRKWRAQVGHNGRTVYVGIYPTIEEAEAAVIAKRNELFTHNDADRV